MLVIYYLTVNNHCHSILTRIIELVKVVVSGVNYILLSL